MKAAAIGRLGEVTKLLQTQRRDSLCGARRIFVNGEPSLPFPRSPQGRRPGGCQSREIFKITLVTIAVEKLPPPPSVKMRRVDESVE